MLIKKYKAIFLKELSPFYDEMEIESFFYRILECFHNKKRIDLALNPEMELDSVQLLQWENVLKDLKKQKPIQYILGETEFYGLPFLVNKNTLIPRPETEELVDLIIKESCNLQPTTYNLQLLDIGTGSGCIAISLAKNLKNAQVFALDVSEKALATAKKNAEINSVEIHFIQADILKINNLTQLQPSTIPFDIIVSNPPYVRNLEKVEINSNVLNYEPHLALFVEDDDPLVFYRKIAELARENLSENGKLYLEINQYLADETLELLKKSGFKNSVLKKDIYGNDRMIICEVGSRL